MQARHYHYGAKKKNNLRHQKPIIQAKSFYGSEKPFSIIDEILSTETDPDADADYKRSRNHYSAMLNCM